MNDFILAKRGWTSHWSIYPTLAPDKPTFATWTLYSVNLSNHSFCVSILGPIFFYFLCLFVCLFVLIIDTLYGKRESNRALQVRLAMYTFDSQEQGLEQSSLAH